MFVIDNNEPRYIEDFRRTQPDWANGNDPNGDPDPEIDWLPAFKRAAYDHLTTKPGESYRFQRTYQRLVFVGRTRSQYKLRGVLHLFGLRLEGLYPGAELYFDQGTDGVHIHYPKTDAGPGTSFNFPTPVTDYGGACTLRNLVIQGTKAAGTRGVIIQGGCLLEAVEVFDFGWHGFHITADTQRTTNNIDGAISNANGTTLLKCSAYRCGCVPGTDPRLVSTANPTGYRPFGSGLRIQGGDANICYTRSFSAEDCARWAIDDVGFLGNRHDLPHCSGCHHVVTQWEADISTHSEDDEEKRDFRIYDVAVGSDARFAYHIEGPSARSILTSPYVEETKPPTPMPIVDVRYPSFVIGGIGGNDTKHTHRMRSGEFTNSWKFTNYGPYERLDETWISEGGGTFITLLAAADDPLPYRLKYVHFKDDDSESCETAEKSDAWAGFFRLDRANLDAQMSFALTGVKSYEKTNCRKKWRKLEPGRLVMLSHYRAATSTHFRKVEYGTANDLSSIEIASHASIREVGDAYICLSPVAGGVYEAAVIDNPQNPGTKIWAKVSQVQI